MSKKYVIEDACLNCQYGKNTCKLKPFEDRHIFIGDKLMASECDIGIESCKGNFGSCRSPYAIVVDLDIRQFLSNQQQLAAYSDLPCEMSVRLQWQNSKDNVYFGGYKALLEEGWTICEKGLGIISLIDSGQAEEDPAKEMLKRLEQLENIVDSYMKEHGIDSKYKAGLMESALLWNGYMGQDMFWDYESSERKRDFCTYLEKENPSLFNYFERGLYLQDGDNGAIDLSYMMGINKAINGVKDPWECVSQTMVEDRGMYNGYLEACRQESGKSSYKLLQEFLQNYSSTNYNANSKYEAYVSYPDEDMRSWYCKDKGVYNNEISVTEQNLGVLYNMITGRIQSQMSIDVDGNASLDEIADAQSKKADKVANAFLAALREDLKKGR
ncbi:MAG TPA: PAAR-like protein [Lachnospiraceae bacterium]|nr:PAAR-like protein [Lachnospiraceae bacterium]